MAPRARLNFNARCTLPCLTRLKWSSSPRSVVRSNAYKLYLFAYSLRVIIVMNCVGYQVTVEDVDKCISKMKLHKAAYLDNITSEHLRYGGPHLAVHLCLLFNSMIHHCFVPSEFCKGIILSLLKNKHGDATDINMYRGITLSPIISKLFEAVLLHLYDEFLSSDSLQFGFKKNSSCTHAMFTVNESVKYFTKKGSEVYCAFLDATKAFDKVLHNGIHKKLLDRGAPLSLVYLLQNWYSNMQRRVKWNNVLGDLFAVLCGVRQDGVLSPALFALYVDDLLSQLRDSSYGIYVGSLFVGCVFYADDIVLLSASCDGLQKLVNICGTYGDVWDIKFNPLENHTITFGGHNPCQCQIAIDDRSIPWVSKVKYLGVYFCCNSGYTDLTDICRKFF